MYRHAWLQALSVNYRIVQKLCSSECSYELHVFILYASDCWAQSQVCMCAFYFLAGRLCVVRIPLGVFWLQHICFLSLQPISGTGSWLVLMLMVWLVLREFNYPEIMLVSVWLLYIHRPYDYVHVWRHFMLPVCPTVASSEVFLAPYLIAILIASFQNILSGFETLYWICVL